MYAAIMILFAALGGWVLYGSRHLIRQAFTSYKWSTTEGTIVDSSDDSFTTAGIDRTSTGIVPVTYHETAHVYEFQVDGRTYRSSTYCFGAHSERAGAAFLIGSKVKVYYDPRDPQSAVLKRGLQPSMLLGPFFLAVALYIAVDLFVHR
jgi:hypothetical protein